MSDVAIQIENLSKQYRLGMVGTNTLHGDLKHWWARLHGREHELMRIGEENKLDSINGEYVWALRNINLEIKQGEVLGIIGKNGAGKSTLLKILSRVTGPTTGNIKIKGRIASLLEVGTGFHGELTGRENIYLNGAILGMKKHEIDRKFDEIVDFSGVAKYIDTPVKRYSSGMYVRLAFAVAAFLEPEILVVDEVLAVGDAEFQKKAIGKMQDISSGQGRTVLFVSHNMASIQNLCNKACIISNGSLSFYGETQTGINTYIENNNSHSQATSLSIEDEFIKVNSIRIYQDGLDKNNFMTSKETIIEIEYNVKQAVLGLRVGFDLYQIQSDNILFRSYHDENDSAITQVSEGSYVLKAIIQNNLLCEGDYLIKFLAGIHNRKWISINEYSISFCLHNFAGINKTYADKRPGLIQPYIKWEQTKNNK